jgi:glutathione peroxidase
LHKDSILVIAFPSNSFGNEPGSDAGIAAALQGQVSFPVARKASVSGADAQPLYQWLQTAADNGLANLRIKADFQKILIGKDGKIKGIFAPGVLPSDPAITNAIKAN